MNDCGYVVWKLVPVYLLVEQVMFTFTTDIKLVFILGASVLQQQADWLGKLR